MYLLYNDESGDPGHSGQGDFLILSGLIIHESRWHESFSLIKQLRINLKNQYDIKRNAELHANKNIAGRGALWGKRWTPAERIRLFQLVLETISQMPGAKTYSICVHKTASEFANQRPRSIHDTVWTFMLQRFENFIKSQRGGNTADNGIVFHDTGHDAEIRKLMRKLRVYNWVPSLYGQSRNIPLMTLVEDPIPRDSAHSQFLQLVDYIAYCAFRYIAPTTKYSGLENVYELLKPVILSEASSENDLGIVYYPKESAKK